MDVGALVASAFRPDCGAVASFVGTTRVDESSGASAERRIIRTPMVGSKSNVAWNDPVTSRTTPAITGPSADAA